MPPPDWSSIQEGKGGGEGGQTSHHGASIDLYGWMVNGHVGELG